MTFLTHSLVTAAGVQLLNLKGLDLVFAYIFGVLIDLDHLIKVPSYFKKYGLKVKRHYNWRTSLQEPVSLLWIAPLSLYMRTYVPIVFFVGAHLVLDYLVSYPKKPLFPFSKFTTRGFVPTNERVDVYKEILVAVVFLCINLAVLHLKPNVISWVSFSVGLFSIPLILLRQLEFGLIVMLISLFLDALDGPIARKYKYDLDYGEELDTVLDRTLEAAFFLSFALAGFVQLKIVLLALSAIFFMTLLRKATKFDPGFKRLVVFLGYFTNFNLAFEIIFWANLLGLIVNLLILDLKAQEIEDLA